MIGYVTIGTNDFEKSKSFYDKALAAMGARRTMTNERMQGFGVKGSPVMLAVCKPYDGARASSGNGTMVSLAAPSREVVNQVHADALAAGHAMLDGFAPVAQRWRQELAIDAGIGIGLHLGEVAFCVLGPAKRKATTLVGDTVNVAARLCSRARAGEVLFSCTVAAALRISADRNGGAGSTSFLQLPQFELRGRRGPIDIWCVPAPERLAL